MFLKYNNDECIGLIPGILSGCLAIILFWITFQNGDFSFLMKSPEGGSSRWRGVPSVCIVLPGLVALYYSEKKILQANKKKNDT
jgi:hypothetical protein